MWHLIPQSIGYSRVREPIHPSHIYVNPFTRVRKAFPQRLIWESIQASGVCAVQERGGEGVLN